MDYSDEIAILTLPHSNDHASIQYHTNNAVVLMAIFGQMTLLAGLCLVTILVPNFLPEADTPHHQDTTIPTVAASKFSVFSADSARVAGLDDGNPGGKLGSAYLYVIIAHLVVYVIVSAVRFVLHRWHYRRLRVIGYHDHYRSTVWLNKATSWIFHRANGLILLATTLLCHYLEDQGVIPVKVAGLNLELKPINVLQVIINLALTIIFPILLKWAYHECRFRRERNPPDIFCLDNPTHLQQAGLGEIGMRSTGYTEELLERQADLIYNLKLQNSHLRWTLHRVTSHTDGGVAAGGGQQSTGGSGEHALA